MVINYAAVFKPETVNETTAKQQLDTVSEI